MVRGQGSWERRGADGLLARATRTLSGAKRAARVRVPLGEHVRDGDAAWMDEGRESHQPVEDDMRVSVVCRLA